MEQGPDDCRMDRVEAGSRAAWAPSSIVKARRNRIVVVDGVR